MKFIRGSKFLFILALLNSTCDWHNCDLILIYQSIANAKTNKTKTNHLKPTEMTIQHSYNRYICYRKWWHICRKEQCWSKTHSRIPKLLVRARALTYLSCVCVFGFVLFQCSIILFCLLCVHSTPFFNSNFKLNFHSFHIPSPPVFHNNIYLVRVDVGVCVRFFVPFSLFLFVVVIFIRAHAIRLQSTTLHNTSIGKQNIYWA